MNNKKVSAMDRSKNKPVKYVVVDAFTTKEFKGNPAAVCLLEEERPNEWLQSVATEFNVSQTAFLIPISLSDSPSPHPRFHLRWFTPLLEVELCGHATLAAAHFCFQSGLVKGNTIEFLSLSGILTAQKVYEVKGSASPDSEDGEVEQPYLIALDFPVISSYDYSLKKPFQLLSNHDSVIDVKKTAASDLLVVLPSTKALTDAQPNLEEIKRCSELGRGLIITAAAPAGSEFDFFSRFFAPKFGIDEDPVCGSAHCALAYYWSKKLGKPDLVAYAAAPRSGIVKLHLDENNRVKLMGKAVTVMEGWIKV